MIVIDSSVLIAILRREPEADRFLQVIAVAERCLLSAVSLLETSMAPAGRTGDRTAWAGLDALIARADMEVVAQDSEQASKAFLGFGKGWHLAALNLGDCAACALAKLRALPLLLKGEDFARTDLLPAT